MSTPPPPKDLVVLTADKNARFALEGILSRYRSLAIKQLAPDYYVHPGKDPGVLRGAHDFLRPFSRSHLRALVVMDREGSGKEELSREEMEGQIEGALRASGWAERASAVVIDPELDIWLWSDSPHVSTELGWADRSPDLRTWLRQQNFLAADALKPQRPKEALEAALRVTRRPRSSALYKALAEKVGLTRCTDPAFLKLTTVLQRWFSET
jgi:hypothetical protein